MIHALRATLLLSAVAACGPTAELAETTAGPGSSGTTGDAPTMAGDAGTTGTTTTAPTTTGATTDGMLDATTTTGVSTTSGTTIDGTTDANGTTGTAGTTTDASSSSTGAPLGPCEELAIVDPVLLQAIRIQLKIPEGPISGAAALEVTAINLVDKSITTLAGVECLENLEALKVSGPVGDLGPLAGLEKLEVLALHGSQVTDLGPLVGAPLTYLTVKTAPLSDLGPLAEIPTLVYLELDGAQITDVSPLASHTLLSAVTLQINMITTLAPLEQAPWVLNKCATLYVSGNPLDAPTLASTIPAMCDLDMTIMWDLGECAPDGFRCGVSDP